MGCCMLDNEVLQYNMFAWNPNSIADSVSRILELVNYKEQKLKLFF